MIRSMTGYGEGRAIANGREVVVEMRSLNHRYFDLSCRLPREWPVTEEKIRALVQGKIRRGKIVLFLSYKIRDTRDAKIQINEDIALDYVRKMRRLAKKLGISDELSVEQVAAHPEIVRVIQPEGLGEDVPWLLVKRAVDQAVMRLVQSRTREGKALRSELSSQLRRVDEGLTKIRTRLPEVLEYHRKRLQGLSRELLGSKNGQIDKVRLDTEIFGYARSTDVREELVRAKTHIKHMRTLIAQVNKNKSVGKELDFTAQEMHREVNTIGQKSSDSTISRAVIGMKAAVERIREQVQNVE
ncbi:MAG: YicC family protein [Candidatus Omnitrophica bacterium]|nr:YicC family protein [Candidatus Omnitrophota bacterium]